MTKTELTKRQICDLIDAVSYMSRKDWAKYKEDGNRGGEFTPNEDAKKRKSHLLNILYKIKNQNQND